MRLDTSTSARLQSWQDALRDFPKHPFLGHGVTGYAFVDAQFPRVLTETGLLGLAAFIYLLVSVFRLAAQPAAPDGGPVSAEGSSWGSRPGSWGCVVHSIGTNTFIIVRIMEPFWFFAGIVAVLPDRGRRAGGPITTAAPARPARASARHRPRRKSRPSSHEAQVCRMGMCDGPSPYIVPLCFGYAADDVLLPLRRRGPEARYPGKEPRGLPGAGGRGRVEARRQGLRLGNDLPQRHRVRPGRAGRGARGQAAGAGSHHGALCARDRSTTRRRPWPRPSSSR
ncbi:MAG: hypothetical protein MZV70_06235 [Desulfobacterales bacterium]|nr:hypothetical protein [Desulfobacterales bacterium]